MLDKKITEIVKTCGLSVIPEVDLTDGGCSHFHNTECIMEINELPYLNLVNISQDIINLKIDNALHSLDFELTQIKDIKEKNLVSYDTYEIHATLLSRLLSSETVILEGSNLIIPKYLEIKSTNSFSNALDITSELVLEAFNKDGLSVYSIDVAKFTKIKKMLILKTLDIPNQWDDVVKVVIKPKSGLVVPSELNLEIKLYYNIE